MYLGWGYFFLLTISCPADNGASRLVGFCMLPVVEISLSVNRVARLKARRSVRVALVVHEQAVPLV